MADGVWLLLPDELTIRLFFEAGIVNGLEERLGERLVVVLPDRAEGADWAPRVRGSVLYRDDLVPLEVGTGERVLRRIDRALDRQLGYYPLAMRLNRRHGFHAERMRPGHPNWMLDSDRDSALPRWARVERAMEGWHFGRRRYVPHELYRRMQEECGALVLSNVQPHAVGPVPRRRAAPRTSASSRTWRAGITRSARASSRPSATRTSSRTTRCATTSSATTRSRQNASSSRDGRRPTSTPGVVLARSTRASSARSGSIRRGRSSWSWGTRPPTRRSRIGFVERMVEWWRASGDDRPSLLFRPHPRDREWRERFRAALATDGIAVQEASYTDFEELATLLQHCSCVVTNAGTILLDALVNDRPSVCVLYDEGAPPGESHALQNLIGEHYRELAESNAFYRAASFEEVVEGIGRALAHPEELADERRRVALRVVGEVDGHAGERVVDAIAAAVG